MHPGPEFPADETIVTPKSDAAFEAIAVSLYSSLFCILDHPKLILITSTVIKVSLLFKSVASYNA